MPTVAPQHSDPELEKALGDEGEKEYRRLLRVARDEADSFGIFLIECDLPYLLKDRLLDRLQRDLDALYICLKIVRFTPDRWDLSDEPELDNARKPRNLLALTGLEDTPGIFPEGGKEEVRPPALQLLNVQRDWLRKKMHAPLLVVCEPFAYTALQKYAPDFFDHFSALFSFVDAAPMPGAPDPDEPENVEEIQERRNGFGKGLRTAFANLLPLYQRTLAEPGTQSDVQRARNLLGLARSLSESGRPEQGSEDRTKQLEGADNAVREALSLLNKERDGYYWAEGQHIEGDILRDITTGDPVRNLRRAIDSYKRALEVYTKERYPDKWAKTQNRLANVYADLSSLASGDREENLRHAIEHFKAALGVYTEERYPDRWAMIQNDLATAYRNLSSGNREENLRLAIGYCRAALRVRTEKSFPQEWAETQNNLGNAYAKLQTGDLADNLRHAIACYMAALRVRTEKHFSLEFAATENNLANVYVRLPTGDRVENIRRAINLYNYALKVYSEKNFRQDRAMVQNNLGNAYAELAQLSDDEREKNLREAEKCYRYALDVRTEEKLKKEYATTQKNLAYVYRDLGDKDKAKEAFRNAERAYRYIDMEDDAKRMHSQREVLS